jgi:hypothetical protein
LIHAARSACELFRGPASEWRGDGGGHGLRVRTSGHA